MKAVWHDQTIAESNHTIVIEGNHYFPPESVNSEFLQKSTTTSECPWKGSASYYNVVDGGNSNKDASWYYHQPKKSALEIVKKDFSNYIAFLARRRSQFLIRYRRFHTFLD